MSGRVTQPSDAGEAPIPGLLSVEAVARAIRRHPEVVRRQARDGRLPGIKLGRGWFFRPEDMARAGYPQFATGNPTTPPETAAQVSATPEPAAPSAQESFLVALSEAGLEALQLTDPDEIFHAVGGRLAQAGLTSYFFLLTEDGEGLRVAHFEAGQGTQALDQTGGLITSFPLDKTPALKQAIETRRAQYIGDSQVLVERVAGIVKGSDPMRKARQIGDALRMRTAISAPLVTRDRVLGAITVMGPGLRESDMPAAVAFANQTAAALESARLLSQSREGEEAMVRTLSAAVQMRDPAYGHADEHLAMAERFAGHLGLDQAACRRVRYSALLQDLGKVGIPDAVLKKHRRLDPEERAMLMTHPVLGSDLLKRFPPLKDLAPLVRAHHELFNGEGYPDGLKGEAIPLETRVVSIVNAFFSVTYDLPFRGPDLLEGALQELRQYRGVGLDPALTDAFCELLAKARKSGAGWYGTMAKALTNPTAAPPAPAAGPRDLLSVTDSRELRIIYGIAQEMSAVLDLDVLLNRIVTIVREVMDYYLVSVLLPASPNGDLRIGAHSGYAADVSGTRIPAGQGVTGWAYAHGTPLIVPDVSKEPRYIRIDPEVRSELAFPLVSRGKVVGVFNAESQQVSAFSEADVALMSAIGSQLAACLEVAQMHESVKREATHDPLTRLFNRRVVLDRIQQEIAHAQRAQESFSVIFLDVNALKHVNDTYGHLPGDALLREVANALNDAVRGEDVVARYGGDEFVVVLPATPKNAAITVAHRVREGIGRHRFMAGGHLVSIPGVSLGIATFPHDGKTAEELLQSADAHLYKQKRKPKPA